MTAQLHQDHDRALALGAAIALHVAAIALIFLLAPDRSPVRSPAAQLVAISLREPPPPPPPDEIPQGAAAPPSRGQDKAPAPPPPPRPLPKRSPAPLAPDAGAADSSGSGAAAGAAAGQGGAGNGSGSGGQGNGAGSGAITPPQRVAGTLTNADYRHARPPDGAAGTVRVEFRVRSDGAVDRCSVLRSSGYAVFDQATCQLIQQRFRFLPARDENGAAIDWTIRTEYTWAPR
ncbi:MAG: energy transducer TonB [Croceibacterium sp.]